MAFSQIDVWNLAASALEVGGVASINERSNTADRLREVWPLVLAVFAEQSQWGMSKGRVALAELATNDRAAEWAHAYALPSEAVFIRRVIPDLTGSDASGVYSVAGSWLSDSGLGIPYLYEGSTLYTDITPAWLEFIDGSKMVPDMTAMAVEVLSLLLAAKAAMPITGKRQKKGDLETEAETKRQRAEAIDINRNRLTYGDYTPDDVYARAGTDPRVIRQANLGGAFPVVRTFF